jgi:response regulator of citrate/malate metabolism
MEKVLAVDDEQDVLFTLEAIGEVADFVIETVDNGKKALKKLQEDGYSLLIVDYHMPGMSGLQLVKEIRKEYKEIPILVLTVDESIELANDFLKAGASDFANKPIKTADLISRINIHLNMSDIENTNFDKVNDLSIPKGMSRKTLKIIVDYLNDQSEFETIEEISEGTGLAYQTVHRYLKFLNNENIVNKDLSYGSVGRPIHSYKIE